MQFLIKFLEIVKIFSSIGIRYPKDTDSSKDGRLLMAGILKAFSQKRISPKKKALAVMDRWNKKVGDKTDPSKDEADIIIELVSLIGKTASIYKAITVSSRYSDSSMRELRDLYSRYTLLMNTFKDTDSTDYTEAEELAMAEKLHAHKIDPTITSEMDFFIPTQLTQDALEYTFRKNPELAVNEVC